MSGCVGSGCVGSGCGGSEGGCRGSGVIEREWGNGEVRGARAGDSF
jgi:hypothetical protein